MSDSQQDLNSGAGPLSGLRVIDMSSLVSGPLCSQVLADLGAEVIKVESAGSDVMRSVQPVHNGMSAFFEQVNRGKKSIVADLKTDAGRDLVQKLASSADIFLQNSRPGVMERLGLGYETLRASNPSLIYIAISGFGEAGPFAKRAAYDAVIQGITGFMPVQGGDQGPAAIRSVVADKVTAIWAANAAMAALLHRERSDGLGQKVVVSMASAYSAFMLVDQMHDHTFRSADIPPRPVSNSLGSYRTLKTSDGEVIGMVLQPSQFERFVAALGRSDLLGDERFATTPSIGQHMDVLYDAIADVVQAMTTAEFLDLMEENTIPFGKVNTTVEFLESQEARYAEAYVDLDDPALGAIRHLNYPAQFERSPANARRRAPMLGEHTDQVISDLRG